jgi:hypothetical protein
MTSLADYLTVLKLHAAGGDAQAQRELDRWERLARAPRKDTPAWIEALQ